MNNPNDLLLFLDVVETGSFQAAANLNYIDRSAVSRRIRQLECSLGTRLLQRSTRSQSLTAAGQEIVRKAKELRQLLLETENIASSHHENPHGLLRINAASNFGQEIVFPVIQQFSRNYPELELELLLEDRWIDLTGEGFDLAFRIGNLPNNNYIAYQLMNHPLKLVAAPHFVANIVDNIANLNNIESLINLPAISYKSHNLKIDNFGYFNLDGQIHNQTMSVKLWLNRLDLILEAVQQGLGYSLMPHFMTAKLLNKNKLVELFPKYKIPDYYPIYAIYPHSNPPLKTKLFLAAIIDYLKEL